LIFILGLYVVGKRTEARAIGGFIPDCIILFKRLLSDQRVPWRYKLTLLVLIGYLALPIDIIPDFIPVVGQLDDAIIVAVVLRLVMKKVGLETVSKNWPGPEESLAILLKLARLS